MNIVGWEHLGWPAVAMVALAVGMWLLSVKLRDVSIVDSAWSIFFLLFALLFAWRQGDRSVGTLAMLVLVAAWALRLSIYITWRNHGHGEDRRYQAIRARNQPNFAFKSLYLVFLLQAVLAFVIAMPLLPALNGANDANLVTWLGMAVAVFGLLFETVGDAQMARFKADPASAGQVMDRGLWRYTRHPNYFGESVFWWGVWIASASLGGAWTVFSPLLMSFLLLRVSGVPLLEADLKQRRPAYAEYLRTTSSFVPWPPKR
jgi:steroid 5-alpha reductase family enzyme